MAFKFKIILFLFLIVIFAVPVVMFANGNLILPVVSGIEEVVEESFSTPFSKLKIAVEAEVLVLQDQNLNSIRLEGNKSLLKQVAIKTTSKTLSIENKDNFNLNLNPFDPSNRLKILVALTSLEELEVIKNSKVEIKELKTESLNIIFDSAGSLISNNLMVDNLKISQSSSGFINFKGRSQQLEAYVSGPSRLLLRGLKLKTANLNAQSNSSVEVSVTEKFKVVTTGTPTIRYEGVPEIESDLSEGTVLRQL